MRQDSLNIILQTVTRRHHFLVSSVRWDSVACVRDRHRRRNQNRDRAEVPHRPEFHARGSKAPSKHCRLGCPPDRCGWKCTLSWWLLDAGERRMTRDREGERKRERGATKTLRWRVQRSSWLWASGHCHISAGHGTDGTEDSAAPEIDGGVLRTVSYFWTRACSLAAQQPPSADQSFRTSGLILPPNCHNGISSPLFPFHLEPTVCLLTPHIYLPK